MNIFAPLGGWNEVVARLGSVLGTNRTCGAGWGLTRLGLFLFLDGKPRVKLWPMDDPAVAIFMSVFQDMAWQDIGAWYMRGEDAWVSDRWGGGTKEDMVGKIESLCREVLCNKTGRLPASIQLPTDRAL